MSQQLPGATTRTYSFPIYLSIKLISFFHVAWSDDTDFLRHVLVLFFGWLVNIFNEISRTDYTLCDTLDGCQQRRSLQQSEGGRDTFGRCPIASTD